MTLYRRQGSRPSPRKRNAKRQNGCLRKSYKELKKEEKWKAKEKRKDAAAAKSLQSCPTLCNPIDGSPPGSFVPGILQARTMEWVAISFSNAWKWRVKVKSLRCVRLFSTTWTAAYQAPLSMGFSRQEYWSGLPLPSPSLYPFECRVPKNSKEREKSLPQWPMQRNRGKQ